jgi:nucleoside-diphosphate-sugar epimerase
VIVVVGGSGFLGTRLCRRLQASGKRFVILDKNPSAAFPDHWRQADVRDLASLLTGIPEDTENIINLAAEHRDDVSPKSLYFDVNVSGAENVCAAAKTRRCRSMLFTSSVACYGLAAAGTGEGGRLAPFNEYGRTKALAESVYESWFAGTPEARLVVVRPTVIFGEQNRGNVYNLLRQIASGRFVMIGTGRNVKSMAYVENVAAFLEHCLSLPSGHHVYNYVDKPDFDMEMLVGRVRMVLGRAPGASIRLPFWMGLTVGYAFDALARATGRTFPISSVRIRKFCSVTQFSTRAIETGFVPPIPLDRALEATVRHEFVESSVDGPLFFSE